MSRSLKATEFPKVSLRVGLELLQQSYCYEHTSYWASENPQRCLRGQYWCCLCGTCCPCADFSSTKVLGMVCSGWHVGAMVNRVNIHGAKHLPGYVNAVHGYSQMQVLSASTGVLTSPLVSRYILFPSVPNLICLLSPCFLPSASPFISHSFLQESLLAFAI